MRYNIPLYVTTDGICAVKYNLTLYDTINGGIRRFEEVNRIDFLYGGIRVIDETGNHFISADNFTDLHIERIGKK